MTYTNPDQIGEVTEITGVAKIIRADGSEEPITLGAEIYIGDIVETDGAGAVNIGFVDDSSFAVSEDARISIDEFVFDPASESGDQDFSVVRGVFMYTSGLIGRENPDSVEIETPVGSIGIRGTIIGGKIVPDGESQVSVLEGAIVVRNDGGEQLLTNQFDTVKLTSRSVAPSEPKTLDVARVANDYGGVKSVSSSLFSSFEDQMDQEKSPNNIDDKKGDVENKVADEDQVEDKEASADEAVDETAEDVAVEDAKETLEADEAPDGPKDAIEHRADDIQKLREHRTERRQQQEKRAELREEAEARQENNEIDATLAPQADALQVSSIAELYENQNGSATGINIGQISLVSGASDVTYSLVNNAGGNFSINATTGVVSFVGTDSGDYEAGDVYNIGVRAVNNNTGQVTNHPYEINVANVNENPEIHGAFQDKFSVTGDIDGVVPFGVDGAMVTRLHINDPDGDVFGVGDLSITGSVFGMAASNFFKVGGNFVLKLLAGYQIIESSGNFLISNDGSTLASGASAHVTPTFDLGVSLNDGGGNTATETITVSANDVEHVTGTVAETLSASDDIVFGDSADNIMILGDDDFKFIKGGDGHDMIKLDGVNGGAATDVFDMTSTVNNTAGNSADLKSIEEFRFVDQYDKLKLNIQDLKDLLRTSENGEVIFASGAVPDGTGAADGVNGVYFKDGGSNVQLTNHGFTNQGTVNDSSETFVKYTHAQLGDVLIEQDINGASAGGII